jgi:nucleotide-binding universal stress UspA family protein|nr:universal stress protein [Streptomyces sp. NBC_00899]
MTNPLTVGVDGSDPSLRAIDWAVSEAALHHVPLRLLHASLWEHYDRVRPQIRSVRAAGDVMAEHIAASAAERAAKQDPTVAVSTEISPREGVAALLQAADDSFALVLGNRGRGELAGMVLGSTSLDVAARATCPVVVVRDGSPDGHGAFGRVTVGVGPEGESSAAVAFAFREAQVRGAELRAVHTWRAPLHGLPGTGLRGDASVPQVHEAGAVLDEALRAAEQQYPDVAVRHDVVEDRARTALLDAATTSDLLVVGARRRRGSVGMQLGQVNHAVLHHADCAVAVVPQES